MTKEHNCVYQWKFLRRKCTSDQCAYDSWKNKDADKRVEKLKLHGNARWLTLAITFHVMKFLTVLSSWGVLLQKIANHMQNSTIPREHFQQCSSDRKNAFYAQAKIIKFLFTDQLEP